MTVTGAVSTSVWFAARDPFRSTPRTVSWLNDDHGDSKKDTTPKKKRIAILGWGSLLWERGKAFDQWHRRWR